MPFYDYHCPMCGGFSAFRTITDRNAPARCPECQLPTRRLITAPNLSLMGAGQRQIFARNEKSRHDPGVQTRHQCGSSCGCGSSKTSRRSTTRTLDLGKAGRFQTARRKKRPWMLGH